MPPNASYNYCGICWHQPKTNQEEPNLAPLRWWDCDDGWKIGTLCRLCWDEVQDIIPQPDDYAFHTTNRIADDIDTDEDITELLFDQANSEPPALLQ